MKPYTRGDKLKRNYPDNHPQKGWVNWWESEIDTSLSKKAIRAKAKKAIKLEIK